MAASVLTACGGSKSESADKKNDKEISVDSLKTIGDIIELSPEDLQSTVFL